MPLDANVLDCGDMQTVDPARLDRADRAALDSLPFAVIGLTDQGLTAVYNAMAVQYGGMRREAVLGKPFFLEIAQCMNNFLVAQRLDDESELDAVMDYVLTYRMRPTPVKLRVLRRADLRLRYVLIQS